MAKKTVDNPAKLAAEMKKLKMPDNVNVFQINKEIKTLFDNAGKASIKAMVELHYDDGTKELTEVKSRLGTSAAITQWP